MGDASAITAAAQATSGAASAAGQVRAGRFNAKVDEFNAKVATMQAGDALRRGTVATQDLRQQTMKLKGAQRAALAAQGIVVDQDTAADLITDTDTASARDEQTIRVNAAREAWGYQVQALDERTRAKVERATSRSDAAGTIMSTVGRFNDATYRRGGYDPAPIGGYSNSTAPTNRLQGPAPY
jgi:hypothetical protein